ncbi:sensor histidine kinase [Lentzea albida]|uniref:Anti-sigma regulatory factor (Ser/Thr protein kinase) n=1 Tax=Lentzea albida TaxID=65499 RepID=A0A1H9V7P2_9PSEU|nr:sensor histidine kinase [Lentzea albida]SES17598.1 Anti-sigma regulatory factor (Ser/Thr protein kinase) [Lentzea albida]
MTTTETDTGTAPSAAPFVHPALFYASDDEYRATLVPFITDGIAGGGPVAVAVPHDRLHLLRRALGATTGGEVTWLDMTEVGRNPGRIIASVLRGFADAHPGRRVRIVGEPVWPGRTDVEYPACAQHEALINQAFAGRDITILCPYDITGVSSQVVADARATHPEVWEATGRHRSDLYAPDAVLDRHNRPLPDPVGAEEFTVTEPAQLPAARRWATSEGLRHGLDADRVADLEYIATELVTNSLVHTPEGRCGLRIWRQDDHVACAVSDTGHLADPLAGRIPRSAELPGGRGLLLVHRFADLVRVHTSPGGTTIYALLRIGKG